MAPARLLRAPSCTTLPDIYGDEDGVAKLVTTVPNSVDYLAGGFYIDVEYGGKVVACGDIKAKTPKAASETRIKGANHERGRAELFQKGSDISGWIKIKGLDAGRACRADPLRYLRCACRWRRRLAG